MKNKLVFLLVVFGFLIGLLFIIVSNRNDKEQLRIEENRIAAHKQIVQDSLKQVEENRLAHKRLETAFNETKMKQRIESEEFTSCINSSITNSSSNIDVSVTIVDEDGNISTSVSSAIAEIYNKTGKNSNTSLLKSSFVHKSGFQELYEGNSDIIERLKLSSRTDYLALGKINYSMRKGTLVEGTIICNAFITVNIISVNDKTIAQSFSFSVSGNGVTESQAKEDALQKLADVYYNEHSSI